MPALVQMLQDAAENSTELHITRIVARLPVSGKTSGGTHPRGSMRDTSPPLVRVRTCRAIGRAGVSMIEVMVVMVIFGILAAIAVPRVDLSSFRGVSAGTVAGSALLAAGRGAVVRQHNVVVAVDEANRRLRIHYDANNNGTINTGEWVRMEPLPDGVVFSRAAAPAGRVGAAAVSFRGRQNSLPAITFLRNGSATEEGGFYLATTRAVAQGRSANVRMVLIDRATGRPSWFTYDASGWKREF